MNFPAALAACLLAASCLSTTAQSLTWDLRGSGGNGTVGNKLIVTEDNLTVTASGWGYTFGTSDNALEAARLGQWSVGMGVTSGTEDVASVEHQVDNEGPDDWILLVFSSKVNVTGIVIDPYGVYDRDVTYWVGNVSENVNLSGKTYNDLAALGFGSAIHDYSTPSESARTVQITTPTGGVNAILIGARRGEFTDDDIDRFKVTGVLTSTMAAVPEPSSLLLGALGLGTLAIRRRR